MAEDESQISSTSEATSSHSALRAIGWVSVGVGIAAVGLFVGRELRKRYKFNRRTPYDVYSHAGDKPVEDLEFGLGI